ncbi:MAG: PAS domain-containing sensor histidine kinase [Anaerolineae bacterium]|nr:PAS domain-containing sensor histidine kinase [Anaerolineae bacterium]
MSPLVLLPFILALAALLVAWRITYQRLQEERIGRVSVQKILDRCTSRETEISLLKALTEAVRSPLILTDANRQIRHLNTAARELFDVPSSTSSAGYDSLIAVTRHHEIDQLVGQALSSSEELETQVILGGNTYRMRVTQVTEGQRIYASIILEDVTELQRLGRARRDMVANISHELRTPITSIRLLVDTLVRDKERGTKRGQELLGKIAVETDTLEQMAQELLDLAMIESGRAELMLVPIDLHQIVGEAVEQFAAQAERKELNVRWQAPQDMVVLADATQIKRVLGNLLHNAIKFTPGGGSITIAARSKEAWVQISVTDTGLGIVPEERVRVFERFYRSDRSRQGGSTGLGLAIAKHIVLAHGGRIWVEEIPNQSGACICFTLPLAEPSSPV